MSLIPFTKATPGTKGIIAPPIIDIIFEGNRVRLLKKRHTNVTKAEARILPVILDRYLEETNTIKSPSTAPAANADIPSQMVPSKRMAKHPAPRAVAKI